MKFLVFLAMAFAAVWAKDLYSPLIEVPVLEKEGRVSNGHTATPGQFKYMVGLKFGINSQTFFCGGSLIGKTWVLTAAHCEVDASWVMVYLGSTIFKGHEQVYNVTKTDIIPHPLFSASIFKHDIGLVRIPETNASSNIGFVGIPKDDNNKYLGRSVVFTGWGETDDISNKFSNDLLFATLKVSRGSSCFALYGARFSNDVHICVDTRDKVSPCDGDSGGPLVLQAKNLQIGVMSYGDGNSCTKKMPVVFTRVSAYRLWIMVRTGIH